MSDGKRYYWLKLYDDFFGSIRIKRLRRMAGGDTYLIIYLKLQLKAMKNDGVLEWKGYDKSIIEELALDLDETPDNIAITLSYLKSCGLAESSDDERFFFPFSVENVGSECSSAKRVREFRERAKLEGNTKNVTLYAKCNGEIEIEKRDREREEIICAEPQASPAPEPAVYSIILNDKTFFGVTESMMAKYRELYPAVDIDQEIRKMIGWCESNPGKRKTRRGIKAFITNWLSRQQDKGPKKEAGTAKSDDRGMDDWGVWRE